MGDRFQVVEGEEGRLSVWPRRLPVPRRWAPVGFAGSREECLAEVDRRAAPPGRPAVRSEPGSGGAVGLFRESVRLHGERPAVRDGRQALTYRELDARSDGLARALREAGVDRGDRVAIHLPPGVDVVVAVLGVLKTGAVYVPVDLRYPVARRRTMLAASGAAVAVAEAGAEPGVRVVPPTAAGADHDAPGDVPVTGHDDACVLFTSGSSGLPKAVVLRHRNLVHFAANRALPALTPEDCVGQVSSVSFDAFHFELWCALAAGSEIAVLPPIAELVADDLGRALRRARITALLAPTMVVNHVAHLDREAFAPLRLLCTGGDVLQPAAARALLAGGFRGEFWNLYGPTEGTTACTAHRVDSVPERSPLVPIGRELDGASVHLLGDDLAEVRRGEPGEVHIGGNGVADRYLGQARLTAERFLPDPFAPEGGVMYATGDIARRRPDGVLEFLGRRDDQVKIRGYRVEPGEVERVLAEHPQVRAASVVAVGDDENRRLVALVAAQDDRLSLRDLRRFAEERVPDHLVPASILRVAEIPGNDNGKRDLAELRRIAQARSRERADRLVPQDEVDRYLVELWEELLAVEWIGAEDDFFALGGNSMQAFRLHRRIKSDIGVTVHVREILDVRSLGKLADLLRDRKAGVDS